MELSKTDPGTSVSPRKGRSRSLAILGSNPLDTPLTKAEFDLAALRKKILTEQAEERKITDTESNSQSTTPSPVRRRARSVSFVGTNPLDTPLTDTEFQLVAYRKQLKREQEEEEREQAISNQLARPAARRPLPTILESPVNFFPPPPPTVQSPAKKQVADIPDHLWEGVLQETREWQRSNSQFTLEQQENDKFKIYNRKTGTGFTFTRATDPPKTPKIGTSDTFKTKTKPGTMNYQNYIDSPGGPGSNPRQAPPSPSQGMNHPNGMNGGMGMGGMAGYPTPAGHQSDLNFIMSMVEDLSAVLRQNQQLSASVVEKVGRVREKAATMDLSNDQLVAAVASELNGESPSVHFHRLI
jgi:hypothetical protein